MKKHVYLLLLVPFLLTSCITEWRLNNKEDRIMGVWEIEKAHYKEFGALFRDNITSRYNGDRIEFLPDFTVIYDDYSQRRFAYGEWELFATREYFDDDRDIDFYDDRGGLLFDLNGAVQRLTYNRFTLRVPDRGGETILRMRKID